MFHMHNLLVCTYVGFLAIKVVKQNLAQKFHMVFTLPVALYVALRPITAYYITSFPNIYCFYILLYASTCFQSVRITYIPHQQLLLYESHSSYCTAAHSYELRMLYLIQTLLLTTDCTLHSELLPTLLLTYKDTLEQHNNLSYIF